jgi:mevalonate kinase
MVANGKSISSYDSEISFLYDNSKNIIHTLDLAQGLIQLLVENNFTLLSLLNTSSSELSKTLGIDEEVATLICKAAKNMKIVNP